MTIYEEIKSKLEGHVGFRERRFRPKYLGILALRKLGLEERFNEGRALEMEDLVEFAKTYDSYRHEYDRVLAENESLRGTDYGDKDKVEQEAQIRLGYESGYRENVKKLETLEDIANYLRT